MLGELLHGGAPGPPSELEACAYKVVCKLLDGLEGSLWGRSAVLAKIVSNCVQDSGTALLDDLFQVSDRRCGTLKLTTVCAG